MTGESKVRIEKHITDIVLFDVIGYSKLSDEDQFRTIYRINMKLQEYLRILFGQSFVEVEEVILGFVPTGDGLYVILNHHVAGYGIFLAISLRTILLKLRQDTNSLFSGLRIAVHFGAVIPIKDLTGKTNFVGSGLNDCSRLVSVKKDIVSDQNFLEDENFIIVSSEALCYFKNRYQGPDIEKFLDVLQFKTGIEVSVTDKHGKIHKAHFIESNRRVAVTPPKPLDLEKRLEKIREKHS